MRKLYISLDISNKSWKICFAGGVKKRNQKNLEAFDYRELPSLIAGAKKRFGLPSDAPVICCHEAGLQGFWIHRYLESLGIESLVVDPASIEVSRRNRRVKTDRIDANKLMNMLLRHDSGETEMWAMIRPPALEVEDERRTHRERDRLKKELTQHTNRILSLLRLYGPINVTVGPRFGEVIKNIRTWGDKPLPPNALLEIQREYARWELAYDQEKEILRYMAQETKKAETKVVKKVNKLQSLQGIGLMSSWILVHEMFGWRAFKNRKQVGSFLGLTGTPSNSGTSEKEQGISKAGNARLRTLLNQLAWLWLRHQPESDLSKWYYKKKGNGSKRMKRVAITGLSRRLAIALWRFVDFGIVPGGAVFSKD